MILQFGTSRFLQAHVALFAHQAREAGQSVPDIVVVKTTSGNARSARLAGFADPCGYRVILRGISGGTRIDHEICVKSVVGGLSAEHDWPAILAIATGKLSHIVSNTGDQGYDTVPGEPVDLAAMTAPNSFPAMVLAVLHARWRAGGTGVVIMPCELVRRNGSVLCAIVTALAAANRCEPAFIEWLETACTWANTLVDRIVSGALEPAGAIAEPYALWAIENCDGLVLPFDHPAMVVTDNLDRFERLKLHILNLGHTWLAERWWQNGAPPQLTVRDSLGDPATRAAFDALFADEVIPGFASHALADDAITYLANTLERFANPFLDHRLADIHVGHAAKITKRIGAFVDWVDATPNPPRLTTLRTLAGREALQTIAPIGVA